MKVSLNWVKEFTDITLTNEEIITRIGERLGAVEGNENWGSYFDEAIVVAEIIEKGDHPDADRLGMYTISIGAEQRQLIAGDKTLQVGDKVGYIAPGAAVPSSVRAGEPFVITEREMRGKVSQGMLGSGAELLFSENHEKVQVLDTDAPVGTPLRYAYKLDDIIIDIENKMFTHRPDCFGVLGVAREIAGIQNIQFSSPEWFMDAGNNLQNSGVKLPITVQNEVEAEVRRFSMVALSDVSVSDSPLLMQSYLMRSGMRPINSVVDITNFVMHLTAQPLHAFDYDKVAALSEGEGAHIVVRKPHAEESLTLLDGRSIKPHADAILIATNKQALAVGGCMGGADSEVDANTQNVLLEVANFDMYSIRRTSFINGIFTDAVSRFNKGQSLGQIDKVTSFAVAQLSQYARAQVASEYVDIYPAVHLMPQIEVDRGFINSRLAAEFTSEEIAGLLRNVEITVEVKEDTLLITPPFWRTDLHIPEDIVEEVGRLYGFDNLPMSLPFSTTAPSYASDGLTLAHDIRKILARAGANEVLSYNFVSEKSYERSGLSFDAAYRIRNALAPDLQFMRTAILPSVLEKIYPNVRQNHTNFVLFELGKVHSTAEVDAENLPIEKQRLTLAYVSTQPVDGAAYYQVKQYLQYLCDMLGVDNLAYVSAAEAPENTFSELFSMLNAKRAGYIMASDEVLGVIGECSPQIVKNYKLPTHTAVVELDTTVLARVRGGATNYQQLSRFPSISEDVTLKTDAAVLYSQLSSAIAKFIKDESLVSAFAPRSIYQPDGSASKNTSFSLTFVSQEKTLTKSEVSAVVARLVSKLQQELGAEQV